MPKFPILKNVLFWTQMHIKVNKINVRSSDFSPLDFFPCKWLFYTVRGNPSKIHFLLCLPLPFCARARMNVSGFPLWLASHTRACTRWCKACPGCLGGTQRSGKWEKANHFPVKVGYDIIRGLGCWSVLHKPAAVYSNLWEESWSRYGDAVQLCLEYLAALAISKMPFWDRN